MTPAKPRILFLCTGNSCRSQMAEGFCRALHGQHFDVFSAGTHPATLDPRAVKAMVEVGIDIAHHQSKHLENFRAADFALVITVCDAARESCPTFPGTTKLIHHSFPDPPRLAASAHTDDQALPHYRHVRDQIKNFIATLPTLL